MENNNQDYLHNQIVEDTTGASAPNVATTDENLSVDGMFQQAALPSLGRQIFPVIPIHGPTAALFNIRRKAGTNDFELIREEVEVYPSKAIPTGLTQEVVQDIKAQYGKNADQIIGKLLRGLANDDENANTINFLDTVSVDRGTLTLTESTNSEVNLFELGQRANELVLEANTLNSRTYKAFCVLPYKAAAAIAALGTYAGGDDEEGRGLFITEINQVRYYLNPVATSATAYVGLRDIIDPSRSAGVFSPYVSTVVESVNPDSGNLVYNIYNRYAITKSPLHEPTNPMLFKFTIA